MNNTLKYLLAGLAVLWILGVVKLPALHISNFPILYLGSRAVGLFDLLTFALIIWIVRIVPSPIREIIMIFLVLWLLSFFGFFFFGAFYNLFMLVLILGLVLYILGWIF